MNLKFKILLCSAGLAICIGSPTSGQQTRGQQTGSNPNVARARNAMVATVNPMATDVALGILKDGGNAVDAAIAAGLTLGVVDNFNSGIGGGCFILIHTAEGNQLAIDGRETAPAAAHRDMYLQQGKPDPARSRIGALAIGVPGAVAAYEMALKRAGTRSLADLVTPAAEIADKGFRIDSVYAAALRNKSADLAKFRASRKILLKVDGKPRVEGDLLIQKDLARTYRQIGEHGSQWFYRGEFAKRIADWMKANGGILTSEDMENYRAIHRTPVRSTYRDHTVLGFPPPSSGGIHVAQILNILENFDDLKSMSELDRTHIVIEAMKLAFADRAHWLGDSDFADVPRGLIDRGYAKSLADRIDPSKATAVKSHGTPPNSKDDLFSQKHTTHLCVVDRFGNWVAITQTVNTTFGSKVIIPGTGVVMNNEMDDFSAAPGVANAYGLLGAEANSVQPGKRPLSSMSPTIVLKEGRPVMMVGAADNPKIITQSLLAVMRCIDLRMPLDQAIAKPRFHHQWSPDRVLLEKNAPRELAEGLEKMGHRVVLSGTVGISQAVARTPDGELIGVSDPRVPSKAAGY